MSHWTPRSASADRACTLARTPDPLGVPQPSTDLGAGCRVGWCANDADADGAPPGREGRAPVALRSVCFVNSLPVAGC